MNAFRPTIGTPLTDLETPCLVVDLDALEHNYRKIADTYAESSTKLRQHVKNIKCPQLAMMQIEAGGTVGGVCAAKVSEAEAMFEGGITDVLIPNQVVTRDKIARLCQLAKRGSVSVVADDLRNVQAISEVASELDVEIGVLVEVDTQMGRAGVRDVQSGVEIARLAHGAPGIQFKGVMSHQTIDGDDDPDRETRFTEGRRMIQKCLDVKDAIEAIGIPVEVVSTGETWTYDVAASIPGVTEVEGGTYALYDTMFHYMDDFQFAAKIMGTVISTPSPGVAIGDTGSRALASPRGMFPSVASHENVTVERIYEDHIVLGVGDGLSLGLGDTYTLHSGQQDIMVNRWDRIVGVRGGVVEGVYDVSARGCHN